jgi:hypothetical protein
MTTEETPRKLWRRKRVAQARTLTALVLDRAPKRSGRLVSIQWSAAAISLFASVQRLAAGTDKDSGQRLPYASLRSVIEARVPGAIVVRSDLSQPWNGGGQRTFLLARGSSDDGSDVMEQVCGAISQWCTDVLFSWAERTGIADLQVERIRELAFQRRIVEKTDVRSASFPTTGVDALKNYPETRDVLKALLLEALDGEELFEGRGPVHRVISSSTLSNEIEFETWPIEIKGGSFSLVFAGLYH